MNYGLWCFLQTSTGWVSWSDLGVCRVEVLGYSHNSGPHLLKHPPTWLLGIITHQHGSLLDKVDGSIMDILHHDVSLLLHAGLTFNTSIPCANQPAQVKGCRVQWSGRASLVRSWAMDLRSFERGFQAMACSGGPAWTLWTIRSWTPKLIKMSIQTWTQSGPILSALMVLLTYDHHDFG